MKTTKIYLIVRRKQSATSGKNILSNGIVDAKKKKKATCLNLECYIKIDILSKNKDNISNCGMEGFIMELQHLERNMATNEAYIKIHYPTENFISEISETVVSEQLY